MVLLDGRKLADNILQELKEEIKYLPKKPGLGVILVGNDPSSRLYVSLKEKTASDIGALVKKYLLPETATDEEIVNTIRLLNKDDSIHGILLQLPIPNHLNTLNVIQNIDAQKDVDGFLTDSHIVSPTIQAIVTLLHATSLELRGKTAVLLINSIIFRDSIALALRKEGIAIIEEAREADIVVTAKGKPGLLTPSMIKMQAVVIDVGIGFVNGKTVGDSTSDVRKKAEFFSPVPGGVGPLTVAYLFQNLVSLSKRVSR